MGGSSVILYHSIILNSVTFQQSPSNFSMLTWALCDISLSMYFGMLGMLGSNGAGKTTLIEKKEPRRVPFAGDG